MADVLHEQKLRQRAHGTFDQLEEQPYLKGAENEALNDAVPQNLSTYADWALDKVIGSGKFQFRYHLLLGFFPKVLLGMQVMIHVFVTLPPRLSKSGELFETEHCTRPRRDITFADPTNSIVSDFGLFCEWEFGLALLGTIFFFGWAIGVAIGGAMADERGRRFSTLAGFALVQAGGLAALAAPTFTAYALARFVTGLGVGGVSVAIFVWGVELLGPRNRSQFMIVCCVSFALGAMLLSPLALAVPLWRALSLFIFLAGLPIMVYLPYCLESPKWLSTQQQSDELYRGLCYIAQVNSQPPPPPPPGPQVQRLGGGRELDGHAGGKKSWFNVLRMLVSDQRVSWRLFALCIGWCAVSLTYYGISMSLRHLEGSIYVSSAVAAAMDIPAVIFGRWAVEQHSRFLGRRGTSVGGLVFGGLCCLLCVPVGHLEGPPAVLQVFVFTAKFAVGISFVILYLFGTELFPTTLRSTSLGLLSLSARIGGMLAPQVAGLGAYYDSLPMAVFGAASLLAGVFMATLPETLGKPMYDTLDEMEESSNANETATGPRWPCLWFTWHRSQQTLHAPPAVQIGAEEEMQDLTTDHATEDVAL